MRSEGHAVGWRRACGLTSSISAAYRGSESHFWYTLYTCGSPVRCADESTTSVRPTEPGVSTMNVDIGKKPYSLPSRVLGATPVGHDADAMPSIMRAEPKRVPGPLLNARMARHGNHANPPCGDRTQLLLRPYRREKVEIL